MFIVVERQFLPSRLHSNMGLLPGVIVPVFTYILEEFVKSLSKLVGCPRFFPIANLECLQSVFDCKISLTHEKFSRLDCKTSFSCCNILNINTSKVPDL